MMLLSQRLALVFSIVASMVILFAATNPTRSAEIDAGDYIIDLAFESVESLSAADLSPVERAERFRNILQRGLDIEVIAGRVLGPYRRRATEAELSEFVVLLEENIVRKYAILFADYGGEKIELVETKNGRRNTEIVTVRIFPLNDAPPIDIRWVTHRVDDVPKVIDIIVERVSMVTTQKEEYVSVIRRGGGKIEALLVELRERNAELAANVGQ